jgi:hypothetical protein
MSWRYSKDKLVPLADVVPAFLTFEPKADESLVGFIDRTFARTVFANPIAALAQAGIATNRPDFLASLDLNEGQIDALARRLGVSAALIRDRLHSDSRMLGSGVRGVDFHGQFLRLTFLERERRRVSPRALEISPYHRAIWDVRPIAFDPDTMELLLSDCPVCAKPLGRRRLCGPEKCDKCIDDRGLPSTDLRDHLQPMVPEEEWELLRNIAGLVDTDPKTRERSCLRFPEPWRSLGPGEIFHILVEMSVANEAAIGQLGPSSPSLPLKPTSLHSVGQVLAGGLDTFFDWAGTTLTRKDLPHWTVDRPVATTGFERLVKCPHISPAAKSLLSEMRSGSRVATRLRRTGAFAWLNAKNLAEEFDLDLTRAQMIVTRLKSVLKQVPDPAAAGVPTSKEAFAALLPRAVGTVSLNNAAFVLKAGVEVVTGLEEIGVLNAVPEPVSLLIEASKSFYEADVRERLASFLSAVTHERGASLFPTMEAVLKNSGLRPLPFAAAWHLAMSGDVRLLREDDEVNDWLRDVYVADEAPFVELLRAHPLTRSLRDLPPEVTTQVAAQMIDSDIVVVGQLVRNKILVPTSGARPLLFPREQIERFVAAYVSTPELKRALGISSAGRFDRQYRDLPESAFEFPNQRSRFYRRKDCAFILAAAAARAA